MRLLLEYQKVPVAHINCLFSFLPSPDFKQMYSFTLEKDSRYCSVFAKKLSSVNTNFTFNQGSSYYYHCQKSNLFTPFELNVLQYIFLSSHNLDLITLGRLLQVEDSEKQIKILYQKSQNYYNSVTSYAKKEYIKIFKKNGGPYTKINKLVEKQYKNLSFYFGEYGSQYFSNFDYENSSTSGQTVYDTIYCDDNTKQLIERDCANKSRNITTRTSNFTISGIAVDIDVFSKLEDFLSQVVPKLNFLKDIAVYNSILDIPSSVALKGVFRKVQESNDSRDNYSRQDNSLEVFKEIMQSEDKVTLRGDVYKSYSTLIQGLDWWNKTVIDELNNLQIIKDIKRYIEHNDFEITFEFNKKGASKRTTIKQAKKISIKSSKLSSSLVLLSQEPFVIFLNLLRSDAITNISKVYGLSSQEVIYLIFLVSIISV